MDQGSPKVYYAWDRIILFYEEKENFASPNSTTYFSIYDDCMVQILGPVQLGDADDLFVKAQGVIELDHLNQVLIIVSFWRVDEYEIRTI